MGLVLLLPVTGYAQDMKSQAVTGAEDLSKLTPQEVIESVTGKILGIAKREGSALKETPQKYYEEFSSLLDGAINFPFIAKAVMGKNYYPSASEKQRADFAEVFKRDIIKTYTGALAIYIDREFKVMPPEQKLPKTGRISVVQEVSGPDGRLKVAYTMARKEENMPWQMINFTLPGEGVNLGATARTQFAQAMASNKGDLDTVISRWGR